MRDRGNTTSTLDHQIDVMKMDSNDKSASTTSQYGTQEGSMDSRMNKSGSQLSKNLPPSHSDSISSEFNLNLPSTIASAFSSISSFGSSFSFNNNQNGNINSSSLTIDSASTSTKLSHNNDSKQEIFGRRANLERKNLISLTKLIVKDLISSSLIDGRTIENGHSTLHLNNYFVLIDRVLKHGLKQNLISNKSTGLWLALDSLPRYFKESTLMSESVRSLAHTKTSDGKIKAWIRLAMMQKKLPEYFSELLANKEALLKDIYHDYAFMLNDEAHIFAGLIIGVNVIDCNYFVKDANFDLMDDIIDLSPYLRIANSFDDDQDNELQADDVPNGREDGGERNLAQLLDQKNYLEEWNKRLQVTTEDLKTKLKVLGEQNSKLEMEAKVSEMRMQNLLANRPWALLGVGNSNPGTPQADVIESPITTNHDLNAFTQRNSNQVAASNGSQPISARPIRRQDAEDESKRSSHSNELVVSSETSENDHSTDNGNHVEQLVQQYKDKIMDQEKELAIVRERMTILETNYRGALEKIKAIERDLDVQTSMNHDKQTTIRIYEKDIQEKQAHVVTLRASMNDSKKLNSELTERLNDVGSKLKDRLGEVSDLQTSVDKLKLDNKTLAKRFQESQLALRSTTNELNKLRETLGDLKRYNERINDELKRERECGHSSSVTVETQNAQIAELTSRLASIETELNELRPYRKQAEEFKRRCEDYEQSLEEVGSQLRESRLEIESLKEHSSVFLDSQWVDSKQVKNCALCQQVFSVTRRKHHCRLCGEVFCQPCSDNKMELASSSKPVRVCDTCHAFLLAKFVKSSTATRSVD